jgi:hypothetical protein
MSDREKLDELVAEIQDEFPGSVLLCAWYLLCDNVATTTRKHPILGDVPICSRCDQKIESLGG